MINKWYQNQPFLGSESGSLEIKALGTALEALKELEVDALEDDAIFDLRPEGPSRRQSLRYADDRVTAAGVCRTIFGHGP